MKSFATAAAAALSLLASHVAFAAPEAHAEAARDKIHAARQALSKLTDAERKASDGWIGASQRSLGTAVWAMSHGRELRNELGPSKHQWKNPKDTLSGVSATYQPKSAALTGVIADIKAAQEELDKSEFKGKVYGHFQVAKGALAAAEDAVRRAAIHIDKAAAEAAKAPAKH